ncbi:long-chain-fatty-acid--CoA ligase [Pseudalkalibacillus caeni]|uniref:Long-chain fatty acid--CoA ligase n=1 Tax=Exobacillus caeni TaxID=2574798 RepID=A0A5R9F9H7_9BACL|nr:long-chain fatty acid--CoA ligase [Pseudalkalibacillus caeni]TLS38288.1 long-chain fatty acid--CoA ligase [Pseudalkalibacillus caeni]
MAYSEKPWLKYYHQDVSEHLQLEERPLTSLLTDSVKKYGDKTALTFYHKTFTFKEVYGIVEQFAACLHKAGFQKGDRLAIMLPNTPHYIFSLFVSVRLGGAAVQVNPMYVEREIEYTLNDSGARFMVVLDALYPKVKSVQKNTSLEKVIVVSLGQQQVDLQDGDLLFEDFLKTSAEKAPEVEIDSKQDVAVLQYTGGTTGVSKGVMLTHYNLLSNVEQVYEFMFKALEVPDNPKVMSVLPMFHIYGLTCNAFQGFRTGGNQIILPRFELQEVLETVKREKPFQMSGVPTMYIALNSRPDLEEYGFDQIEHYNSGGAAMPVEQLKKFEERTGKKLCEGYGLSEASPVTHFNPPFAERRIGSIGIPMPGTVARVVIPSDGGSLEDVPQGEVGELAINGPQVMKGYWDKPEETEAVLKGDWLLTGDLARMDEDGYFSIVDRKKDMIIASGYNIYPREIEEVLYQHPAVQELIVLGIPDEYRGETVKAYITLKEGEQVTEDELMTFARKYLAAYKVPTEIEFREVLPKSAVGKLLKRKLRDEEVAKKTKMSK